MNLKKKNLKQLSEDTHLNLKLADLVAGGAKPPIRLMCTTTLDTEMKR
ncbi:hypothetical protein [Pseudoalteromonas luteoviolacea]|uniref:Uncharacterized protein n=1 Tax=Pseudoalteromonas luteoviolacea S4054 TaxID=1129367 RepID=A0A0F6A9X2_9GAMM|nr:hypothetical protein [Pseudoalteromonas luteoviolacea]KKE82209.1 hypothetical protein N479_19115 [Pseudoalteromonas luteoviolacea S4054]KZN65459.1 hypothetical protein N481_25220 [Pseudoalteromonas luteoviolacea S4047-1]